VKAVQDVTANDVDLETFTREDVEARLVTCPQQDASDAMVSTFVNLTLSFAITLYVHYDTGVLYVCSCF
jgi:hypothetical protein